MKGEGMDIQSFEKFRRPRASNRKAEPLVTLSPATGGRALLNEKAYALLGMPEAVEVLYAPDEQILALKASTRDSKDSYVVNEVHNKSETVSRWVRLKPIIDYYGIVLSNSRIYSTELEEDMLWIRLGDDSARSKN